MSSLGSILVKLLKFPANVLPISWLWVRYYQQKCQNKKRRRFLTNVHMHYTDFTLFSEKAKCPEMSDPVSEGQTLTLRCDVSYSGPWPPLVQWKGPGGIIESDVLTVQATVTEPILSNTAHCVNPCKTDVFHQFPRHLLKDLN